MSQREFDRFHIIVRVVRKELRGPEAADLLRLSTRQIRRLKARIRALGAQGLVHGNRGRQSNHRIPAKERYTIATLIKTKYPDFGPTLAGEKLSERHGINRDVKTIRAIMIAEHLWRPKRKQSSEHRTWRQRRACFGDMQQFDGSYEHWFEGRAPKCCLLAAIDDATGMITHAQFGNNEGVAEVFLFWQQYIEQRGKPRSIYLDKFSTYKMNPGVAQDNHELKTQFERAVYELHIEPITAHSPEAKGRVERLFGTLQDRLTKELRLAGISTIDEANRFLQRTFLPRFNAKFSIAAANPANLHQPLGVRERERLPAIFSKQYIRTVHNDFTISFNNQWYQLVHEQPVTVCKQDRVTIEERLDHSVHIRLRGKYLRYRLIPKRIPKAKIPWVLAAIADPYKADISISR